MIEQKIQISTTNGTAESILFRPEDKRRWPGVIQYTDIWRPAGCPAGILPAAKDTI